MAPIGTIYGAKWQSKTVRSLALAHYIGADLKLEVIEVFTGGSHTPEYTAKFPFGKMPGFETADGLCLSEGGAIARYIASTSENYKDQMLGADAKTAAQIDQWCLWSDDEFFDCGAQVIRSYRGIVPYNQPTEQKNLKNLHRALTHLEKTLQTTTFLVGHRITLADITVASNVHLLYSLLFGPEVRAKYPNVQRYVDTVVNQPEFGDSMNKNVPLIAETLTYTPPKKEEKPKAAAAPAAPAAKKEKKPKAV
ncbi:hypothetical protein CF327_g4613, partial [Tilletia walkeri]